MTVAGVEIILLHLSVGLVKTPVIVIEAVYRSHDSGSMPPARAVNIKLAGGRIVSNPQKLVCLFHAWICFINKRDINVAHSRSLNGRLFVLSGVVGQVDDGLDTKRRKASK